MSHGFAVRLVRCPGGHTGWSAPEESNHYGVVLVRSGIFRWRHRDRSELADPSTGYLIAPGDAARFSHPAGGDVCSSIVLDTPLWRDVVGDRYLTQAALRVDARLELAHRRLLRAADDPSYAGVESLLALLTAGVRQLVASLPGLGPSGTARARAAVAAAREAIMADDPAARDLRSLARRLDVSPYHLSRTFRRHTGQTLTSYRNRIRVSRALSRLEAGELDLAGLAADLGFADQSHLTRVLRAATDHPPSRLARLLGQ